MGYPKSWTYGVVSCFVVFGVLVSPAYTNDEDAFPKLTLLSSPNEPAFAPIAVQTSCMPPISTNVDRCLGSPIFTQDDVDGLIGSMGPSSSSSYLMTVTMDNPATCESSSIGYSTAPTCPTPEQLQDIIGQGKKAALGACCQMKKNMAINGEIACMQKAVTDVNANLAKIKQAMDPMLTAAGKAIAQLDSDMKDRDAQIKEIQKRMDKTPNGLREIKTKLENMMQQLPLMATNMKQQARQVEDQKARFVTLKQQHTMSLAWECFANTPQASKLCGGVPVSYMKWIACQHGEYMIKRGSNRDQALKYRTSVEEYLSSTIGAEMPQLKTFPQFKNTSDAAAASAEFEAAIGSSRINTPTEFYSTYASALEGMQIPNGFPVAREAKKGLERCYAQMESRVNSDLQGNRNSPIFMAQQRLADQEKLINDKMNIEVQNNWGSYKDMVAAITPSPPPGDSAECLAGNLETKANCMSMFANMANALLNGQPVNMKGEKLGSAAMSLTNKQGPLFEIPNKPLTATNPKLATPVTCTGIRNCVAKYDKLADAFQQDLQDAQKNRENYHRQVNNTLKTKAQALSAQLSAASKLLRDKMARLTNAKAAPSLNAKEPSQPSKINESQEMYSADDLKNMVLAGTEPPLYDMTGDGFKEATEAVQEKEKTAQEDFAKIEQIVAESKAEYQKCQAKEFAELVKERCDYWQAQYDKKADKVATLESYIADIQNQVANVDSTAQSARITKLEGDITNLNNGMKMPLSKINNCKGILAEDFAKNYNLEGNQSDRLKALMSGDTT